MSWLGTQSDVSVSPMKGSWRLGLVVATTCCVAARVADARVVRIDIATRTDLAAGAPFGNAGTYERITGRVYFVFDPRNPYDKQIADLTLAPMKTISLGHRVGASRALGYPVADAGDSLNVLTVRDAPLATRTVVPRSAWRFAREDSGHVVDDMSSVYMAAGFEPGKIYEVVY